MKKITAFLIRFRWAVLAVFALLCLLSLLLLPQVRVNYDLAEYLPADSQTKVAIDTMTAEFGYNGSAEAMAEGVSISQALALKEQIAAIDGVKSVMWLDDVADITQPLEIIGEDITNSYYKEGDALFQITFEENDYSTRTTEAVAQIKQIEGVVMRGAAVNTQFMQQTMSSEIVRIMLIVVPLCVLILVLASRSWLEAPLYLGVIGVSILINMGTNAMFGSVSFIINSMGAVLQLAIAMDYSLFYFHRYLEERERGLDVKEALCQASHKAFSSVSSSALTTIAGFLALLLMQYAIGKDFGLVLAKGIVISFVCVMALMPVVVSLFHKQFDKTTHRAFLPSFGGLGRFAAKFRVPLIVLVVVATIPSFLASQSNHFLYGDSSGSSASPEIANAEQKMEDRFGVSNPVVLLVPRGDAVSELQMARELERSPYVQSVTARVTMADPTLPDAVLPQSVLDNFVSEHYSRLVVSLNVAGETPATFAAVDDVRAVAERYYPGAHLEAGTATSLADIKESIESDSLKVTLCSILAVALIILFTFRSVSLPVLLVAVIEASVFINMGVPYFKGASLIYIGYLVISSLQLGATIDYAILVSTRYLEHRRQGQPARQAAVSAIGRAGGSVMVSALILAVAGYAEGLVSQVEAISTIGTLLGRGAVLSGVMVLVVLPALLIVCDKLIMKTTLHPKGQLSERSVTQ